MRALIYCRVSQDKRRGKSVAEQEAECRDVCADNGWEVAHVVVDNDRSASSFAKKGRPGWAEVEGRIDAGEVDVLVVWELSRATREVDVAVALRTLCRRRRVLVCYRGDVYNVHKASDAKRFLDDANDAEYESARTSERIKRSTRSHASKGMPHGRRLFGYRRQHDPETGQLLGQTIDPDEAELLTEAARRVLDGEPLYAIARDWKARGVTTGTGAAWQITTIRRSLLNPAYNAKRVHRTTTEEGERVETIVPANWPAIIDDDTHARLVALLTDPQRRTTTRGSERAHLLSNVARCGECGAPMKWWRDRGTGIYACSDAYHNTIREHALDEYVEAAVVARLSRPDVAELVSTDVTPPETTEARAEVAALRQRLDDAAAAYVAGEITAQMLAAVESRLLDEIREAEAQLRVVNVPPHARRVLGSDDPAAAWSTLDLAGKVEVIRSLMTVTVHRATRPRGVRGFDPERVAIGWAA